MSNGMIPKLIAILTVGASNTLFASEKGAGGGNPLIKIDPGLFIWTIITFLVLLGLLAKFVWKPLVSALQNREDRIKKSLEDAEKAQHELERVQAESEKIVAKARAESQTIISEGKAASANINDEMMAKAKEKANSIVEDAKKQIDLEKDKAISSITSEVVELSLMAAEKLLRRNLSSEDNRSLVEESLKEIKPIHEA